MELVEVKDKHTARAFLMLPVRLYKNEENWIRPLDKDIDAVFNPEKNKYFRHGKAIRWVLKNENGEVIGRVAAFVNEKTKDKTDVTTGGMGFFECIDDKKAAFKLFDQCAEWLKSHGMEAMDGPINFGERERWWGLLIEGFEEPNYCMPYNFLYYKSFFEEYGFGLYYKQFTFSLALDLEMPESWREKAQRVQNNPDYEFRCLDESKTDEYAEYFRTVYNLAWANHSGVSKMSVEQSRAMMKQLKPVLVPELMWFSFYKKEAVGFFIMLPELNQIFKHVNGNLNWWGKLTFLWHKWRKKNRKIFGVAFGIIPEHQKKGVEGAMVMATAQKMLPLKRYDVIEMNWIGDFNPKMIHICKSLGAKVSKTHITYRYLFDRNIPFERAPMMD